MREGRDAILIPRFAARWARARSNISVKVDWTGTAQFIVSIAGGQPLTIMFGLIFGFPWILKSAMP